MFFRSTRLSTQRNRPSLSHSSPPRRKRTTIAIITATNIKAVAFCIIVISFFTHQLGFNYTTLNNTTQQIIQSNTLTIENGPITTAQSYTSALKEPPTDNKPSPIEPNNKRNAEKYKNSTPTKQSQLSDDDNDSFSACILRMDDNYRLEEWLAYHYYLMKLRYVVINIDPWSKTSPQSIIDRWNDAENKYNLNMTIVTMTDSEYVPDFDQKVKKLQQLENIVLAQNNSTSAEASTYIKKKTGYIILRQKIFYKACSHHLIEHSKSW